MNSTLIQLVPRALLAATLIGLAPLGRAHDCTLADTAGKYGYTSSGTIVTPQIGPFTAVGHVDLSESGTFSGGQTTSIAGNLVEETVQGMFMVNADCTGAATVYVYHGATLARTSQINLVWDIHENEFRAIFLTPGTNISIQGRKMTDGMLEPLLSRGDGTLQTGPMGQSVSDGQTRHPETKIHSTGNSNCLRWENCGAGSPLPPPAPRPPPSSSGDLGNGGGGAFTWWDLCGMLLLGLWRRPTVGTTSKSTESRLVETY